MKPLPKPPKTPMTIKDLKQKQDSFSTESLVSLWSNVEIPNMPLPTYTHPGEKKRLKKLWTTSIKIFNDSFRCQICDNTVFETKLEATKHFIDEHLDDPNHFEICQYCVEVFRSPQTLTQHHIQVHAKAKRLTYKCNICKTYPLLASLTKMKEHYWRDHEKNQFHPYQCKHCDKKFDIWEDMLLHESEVHETK